MEIDTRETEGGRNQRAGLFPVGPEGLPVLVELRIEPARPPGAERVFHRCRVNAEQIREGFQIWRQRHDGADIEVPIGPGIEALPDTWRKRIVDG